MFNYSFFYLSVIYLFISNSVESKTPIDINHRILYNFFELKQLKIGTYIGCNPDHLNGY